MRRRGRRFGGRQRPGLLVTLAAAAMALAASASPVAWAADQPPPGNATHRELREDASLRGVAFRNASVGVAVGDRGTVLATSNGGVTWHPRESGVDCTLNDVFWLSERRVVAVGGYYDKITQLSRGVVVLSNDAGERWSRASDEELARLHRLRLDPVRSLLLASGDWSPPSLSQHYESRDGGATWNVSQEHADETAEVREPTADEVRQWALATGARAPIRSATRAGSDRFWAVGDHGLIYHSDNGGQSWKVQRGERRQTAVLVVAASAASVPWPLVGSEALEMGHRVAVLLLDTTSLVRGDPTLPRKIDLARQAAVELGAAGVDAASERDISAWLAVHQPSVLVLDRELSPEFRERLTQEAISGGAQRVVVHAVGGDDGESQLHRSAMLPHSGVLAGDLWQDALHLVAPGVSAPQSLSLRRSYDAVGGGRRGESVLSGLAVPAGRKLASERPPASRRQLQIIQARLSEPRRIDQLIATRRSRQSLAAGIEATVRQSAAEDRLRLAWSIYQAALESQDRELQEIALQMLIDLDRVGTVGLWAQLRADAMAHSAEWKLLARERGFAASDQRRTANGELMSNSWSSAETVAISPFQTDDSRVVTASASSPLVVPNMTPEVAVPVAADSLPGIASARLTASHSDNRVDLVWEFHPLVLLARDALRRQRSTGEASGEAEGAGNVQRLSQSAITRQWSKLAGPAAVTAKSASAPPRLDGALDDACWSQGATPLHRGGELRLAYDSHYLYLAVSVPAEQLLASPRRPTARATVRDNDLSDVARLGIAFDIDRDLMTAFRLETTEDRLTRDGIDQQLDWQPTWYVASAQQGEYKVFELAFLVSDFGDAPPASGDTWFCEVDCLPAGQASRVAVVPQPQQWIRFQFE